MSRFILLISFTSFCLTGFSQQSLDSLLYLLNQTKETVEKVDLLNQISESKQPDAGKEEALAALQLAKKLKDKEGAADAYHNIGFSYYHEEKYKQATNYIDTARTIFNALNMTVEEADALLLLASINSFQNKYNQSLTHLLVAKKIGERTNDHLIVGSALHSLAIVHSEGLANKQTAKQYFLDAIQILEKEEVSYYLLDCYYDLAFFYLEEESMDSLLYYVEKGKAGLSLLKASIPTIDYEQNFTALKGYYYLKMNKIDSAKLILNTTLPYFESHQKHFELVWHYSSLAEIALVESNFTQAIAYGKKATQHDIEGAFIDFNLSLIRDAYKQVDKDSFLHYNEKYIAHVDTLDLLEEVNQVHETLKKEAIKAKDAEIKERNYLLYGSILLALLLGFGLLKLYQSAQLQKKQVNQLAQEKDHIKVIFEGKSQELEVVKEKVKTIERSLLSSQLNLERQQSSLSNIAKFLKQIVFKEEPEKLQRQLKSLSREIESNLNQENRWQLFTEQFEKVHPQFFSSLVQAFPNLNNRDLRLCAYIRLGMDNQEIAKISGIESGSVIKAKHRMKKKLGLEKEQQLNSFLFNFNMALPK